MFEEKTNNSIPVFPADHDTEPSSIEAQDMAHCKKSRSGTGFDYSDGRMTAHGSEALFFQGLYIPILDLDSIKVSDDSAYLKKPTTRRPAPAPAPLAARVPVETYASLCPDAGARCW